MRVLVTGGAGYIGSVLVPALLEDGHEVTVLDDFRYGQTSLASSCAAPGFEIVRGNARDTSLLRELAPRHDAFIPLAAIVGAPACDKDPIGAQEINFGAVSVLCDVLASSQIVLYPNTNSGYGIGGEEYCTEESPLRPVSLYGRTKVEAENVVMERGNSLAFRLATVFGVSPRMRTDLLVNDFVRHAVFGKTLVLYEAQARRNFVHIRDVAAAFLHAVDNFDAMRGRVYNCGDTRANMTKAALCDAVARRVVGFGWSHGRGADPDKRDYVVLNDRLEATGWKPAHSLDDGIVELLKFYRMAGNMAFGNA